MHSPQVVYEQNKQKYRREDHTAINYHCRCYQLSLSQKASPLADQLIDLSDCIYAVNRTINLFAISGLFWKIGFQSQ